MDFEAQLVEALSGDPAQAIIEFKDRVFTRGEFYALARSVDDVLTVAGVPKDASVGVIMRNRPLHAAVILGLIMAGRRMTSIYSQQSPKAVAQEVRESRFAAVIADAQDWSDELLGACAENGGIGIKLDLKAPLGIALHPALTRLTATDYRRPEGEPALEILSSGTTGKPKRIRFPFRMLVRTVESVKAGQLDSSRPADICTWPFAGIGGVCNLVADIAIGRYLVVLEKFNVPEWVDAVKRYRPSYVSGPPAVAQMMVDAGVPPEDVASIKYFYGGSAPLTVELRDALTTRYGITSIWAYGATEFCGTIISWSVPLHEKYGESKKGAMGVALPGVQLRTVDVETGAILPPGREGYLEALVPVVGPDWIRTTDLVLLDEDGFAFHRGRGDGAIMRGGFKIIPETVGNALRKHPAVLDAAIIGIADRRLGQIPVAAVEIRSGAQAPSPEALIAHVRDLLPSQSIPTEIRVLDTLPRTPSLKIDLGAIRRLFEAESSA